MIKPKKSVVNMEAYNVPLFKDEYLYKLDENENVFGPSPMVLEVLKNLSNHNIQYYPAYGKLLKKLSEINNLPIDYFINTNGADEAISIIAISFFIFIRNSFSFLKLTNSFL